ncbi:MAG: energy transducer TonB [Thermodesulfobacteriota bacterium]
MRIRFWHKIETWNLKIFFSVSLGVHLLFFSIASILFPDVKIDRLPTLNIEVSLLPFVAEEKSKVIPAPPLQVKAQSRLSVQKARPPEDEGSFRMMSFAPAFPDSDETRQMPANKEEKKTSQNESREEPAYSKESEPESPLPVQTEVSITHPLNDPPALPSQNEEPKIIIASQGTFFPKISSSGEPKKVSKYPSPSDSEVVFAQPKYAENPKPLYPQEARKKGYEGEVLLRVEVLANGRVGQVEVKKSSGHELLDNSALTTVKQWRFIPAKRGESPVPLWVNIPIKFQLQ